MNHPAKPTIRQAVILLGGKGTRLSALYPDVPKALAPVAGKPFLVWQLDWLRRGGFTHVHLAAGHLADVLQAWLQENTPPDLVVTCSVETTPLGTGGAIRYVEPHLIADPFFVLNGDSLSPRLSFQSLENSHLAFSNDWKTHGESFQSLEKCREKFPIIGKPASPPLVTLGVARIEQTGRYGTVEFDEQGRITAFLEKTDRANGWINTGVYLINRSVLDLFPAGVNVSIETEIFPELASLGLARAFRCEPPLLDMGTPDGLAAMERYLADTA